MRWFPVAVWICAASFVIPACAERVPESEMPAEESEAQADEQALLSFEARTRSEARAMYSGLEAGTKVRLWRAHFVRLAPLLKLTPAQRLVLDKLVPRLPELVSTLPDAETEALLQGTFTEAEQAALFEQPGEPSDKGRSNASFFAADDCETRWCICNIPGSLPEYNSCPSNCSSTGSGCGWFGQQSCTRYCSTDSIDEVSAE